MTDLVTIQEEGGILVVQEVVSEVIEVIAAGPQGPQGNPGMPGQKGDPGDLTPLATAAKEAAENAAASALASQTAAAGSATAATGSAATAATKASEASASALSASTAASTATSKASEASSSAADAAASATSATTSKNAAATSETNALTSKNAAATSATNAAASATTATTKAAEASTSATSASGSASTATSQAGIATTKATEAAASATAAAGSATSASTSASTATTQATAANTSAGAAQTSASNAAASAVSAAASKDAAGVSATTASTKAAEAATSATTAGTAATTATTQAGVATTKAAEAVSSANSASASATAASGSATTAATQATNASSSASAAQASAVAAAASESAVEADAATATAQAGIATAKALEATTKAAEASASASTASTGAATATTKANEASDSATSALAAKVAAETVRDQTLAAFDSFDDRYLGPKATDPTVDNDGNALVSGSLYYNTAPLGSGGGMKVYDATGGVWLAAYASLSGALIAANNLSDLSSASAARTNLGLGNVENKSSATILGELTSSNVTTALGFTPYSAANPSGYITSTALSPYLTSAAAEAAYQPVDADLTAIGALAGTSGFLKKTAANTWTLDTSTYLTGITSGQVTTALGFTPYDSANPSGYVAVAGARAALSFVAGSGAYNSTTGVITIPTNTNQLTNGAGFTTNTGTVTSVSGAGTVSGLTLTGTVTGSGSLTLGGTLSLTSGQVTTALGYTPVNPTAVGSTIQGYDADLAAIAALAGTSGLLRKTAADTWSLDTAAYLTDINSSQVTTALGFTPYNATNPAGYITSLALTPYLTSATAASTYQPIGSYLTSINSSQVTTALGYTPANKAGDTFTGNMLVNAGTDSRTILQVSGVTQAQFQATASAIRLASNNTTPLVMSTNGVDRVSFDSAGNVTFGSASASGVFKVQGLNTGDLVVFESSDASATAAPDVVLYRNSGSPAAADQITNFVFRGKNSAAADQNYARILATIVDPTSGAAVGDLRFGVQTTSGFNDLMTLASTGLSVTGVVSATSFSGSGANLTGLTSGQITTALGFTPGVGDVTQAGTQTLTNKRITPRVVSIANAVTITPTGDTADQYVVTALAQAATIATPSGTPTDGQKLVLRFEDNGTARALTWTTSAGAYRAVGTTLPTTTVISKALYVGCIYNSQDGFWDVIAVAQQA